MGHEMLFGYATAVVAGFVLTAVPNWTQQPTPTGGRLAALVLLWAVGRVLIQTPFGYVAAVANAAFPIAIAAAIAGPLLRSGNRRNYFLIGLLLALGLAAFVVHLAHLGVLSWPARAGLQAGLDIVLFVMAVIAGRVVPMFTNNGVPRAGLHGSAGWSVLRWGACCVFSPWTSSVRRRRVSSSGSPGPQPTSATDPRPPAAVSRGSVSQRPEQWQLAGSFH